MTNTRTIPDCKDMSKASRAALAVRLYAEGVTVSEMVAAGVGTRASVYRWVRSAAKKVPSRPQTKKRSAEFLGAKGSSIAAAYNALAFYDFTDADEDSLLSLMELLQSKSSYIRAMLGEQGVVSECIRLRAELAAAREQASHFSSQLREARLELAALKEAAKVRGDFCNDFCPRSKKLQLIEVDRSIGFYLRAARANLEFLAANRDRGELDSIDALTWPVEALISSVDFAINSGDASDRHLRHLAECEELIEDTRLSTHRIRMRMIKVRKSATYAIRKANAIAAGAMN